MSQPDPKVIVALDFPQSEKALDLVSLLSPDLCRLKVGKELFTLAGPDFVRELVDKGFDVFLDLKFHDIPNTVKQAVNAACNLGVWMVNIHAMGGADMMTAAREAVDSATHQPKLIAVSVLTSMKQTDLEILGISRPINELVSDLTGLALSCGLDGMVCSALEASSLRDKYGQAPLLVTPGIRPVDADTQDQHRIMTPEKALNAGSSYLVIGRPITQHQDPLQALHAINQSITG
jgi:orotidine-5'-phosphate decarboxylase